MAIVPKDGGQSLLHSFHPQGEAVYDLTFHPNLGRIYREADSWFLWGGGGYREKASLLRLDEETHSFETVDEPSGELSKALVQTEKDNEAFILLNRYNDTSAAPMIYSDMSVGTRDIAGGLSMKVEKEESWYSLTIALTEEIDRVDNAQIKVEYDSEVVSEEYIKNLH